MWGLAGGRRGQTDVMGTGGGRFNEMKRHPLAGSAGDEKKKQQKKLAGRNRKRGAGG